MRPERAQEPRSLRPHFLPRDWGRGTKVAAQGQVGDKDQKETETGAASLVQAVFIEMTDKEAGLGPHSHPHALEHEKIPHLSHRLAQLPGTVPPSSNGTDNGNLTHD